MATRSLTRPAAAEPISVYKAGLLCAERDRVDEERLAIDRQSADLKKRIDQIDDELCRFVDADGGKIRTVLLKRWRLSIVQVTKSVYWLRELTQQIGQEAIDALREDAGTKDSLSIEAVLPAKSQRASGKNSPRARHKKE